MKRDADYWGKLAAEAEAKKRDASFFRRQQALAVARQIRRELRQERKRSA